MKRPAWSAIWFIYAEGRLRSPISVTDAGTGIPRDIADRIFDPFFTTKPIGQDRAGPVYDPRLRAAIRRTGARPQQPRHGTTMCLYLPRYSEEIAEEVAGSEAPIPEMGAGETVLVIDDEPTVRMLIMEVLEDAGYVALEAEDGASGLKILQSEVRINLLITDVGLPGGMNGQIADAARISCPGLRCCS